MRENRPAIILHYLVDGLSFVDLRTQGTIPAARVARHEKGCLGFSTVEMHKGKRVETPISFFGKPFTATQIKAAPSSVLSEPAKVRMLEDMKTGSHDAGGSYPDRTLVSLAAEPAGPIPEEWLAPDGAEAQRSEHARAGTDAEKSSRRHSWPVSQQ